MQQLLLGLSLASNIILGGLIFYRGLLKNRAGLLMSGTIFFVALWTIGDYLLLFGRTTDSVSVGRWMWTVLPMFAILVLYSFARVFIYTIQSKTERLVRTFLWSSSLIWIFYFAFHVEKVISIIDIQANGRNQLVTNSVGFQLYTLFFSVYFSATVLLLYIKHRRLHDLEKIQAQYLLFGVSLMLISATTTNLILPSVFSNLDFIWLGPIFSIFYISSFAYAIFKHQLFDINRLLARSLTYVLVLGTLATLFVVVLVTSTSLLLKDQTVSLEVKVVYVVVALMMTFIFQPLKRRFDRLSNSIFYRDDYDPQELVNELNQSLVKSIELEDLLKDATRVIQLHLKTEFCLVAIKEVGDIPLRIVGHNAPNFLPEDIETIRKLTPRMGKGTVVRDNLRDEYHELRALLTKYEIGAFSRLTTHSEGFGYLVLGNKKSGNPYSTQDARMVQIITDELVLGVQNALRFEEIQQFNVTLQQKVEEATKELRKVNAKLRELDKTKDEFISMASHQLRTPLTTVKGYLSMILDGDTGAVKKEQKDLIQHSFDGAQRMVYLIADLLNVSRLQTGKFVIDNKPTDLATVVEGEIEQLKEQAANREIQISYKKPEHFPVLNLDETKIRQVIMNFLDNALYYTPKGGKVNVELAASASTISYTVTDTGVGVPKDVQHHLFAKFYRADNARKMRPDGTGLGLFMAKKVIVAQGGAIIFSSTEGKGSTFGFSFPRKSMEVKGDKSVAGEAPKAAEVPGPVPEVAKEAAAKPAPKVKA